jgi:hypothetical protein
MESPTATEINPEGDPLDGETAVRNFLGKSLADAEALFCNHAYNHRYFEDLYYMGPKAFRYYVPAAIRCFECKSDYGYPLGWFLFVLESRLGEKRDENVKVIPVLRKAVQYLLDRWDMFDDGDVYEGSLEENRRRYARLLAEMCPDLDGQNCDR